MKIATMIELSLFKEPISEITPQDSNIKTWYPFINNKTGYKSSIKVATVKKANSSDEQKFMNDTSKLIELWNFNTVDKVDFPELKQFTDHYLQTWGTFYPADQDEIIWSDLLFAIKNINDFLVFWPKSSNVDKRVVAMFKALFACTEQFPINNKKIYLRFGTKEVREGKQQNEITSSLDDCYWQIIQTGIVKWKNPLHPELPETNHEVDHIKEFGYKNRPYPMFYITTSTNELLKVKTTYKYNQEIAWFKSKVYETLAEYFTRMFTHPTSRLIIKSITKNQLVYGVQIKNRLLYYLLKRINQYDTIASDWHKCLCGCGALLTGNQEYCRRDRRPDRAIKAWIRTTLSDNKITQPSIKKELYKMVDKMLKNKSIEADIRDLIKSKLKILKDGE